MYRSVALGILYALCCMIRFAASREFSSTFSNSSASFSLTQIQNPKYKPYQVSTTAVYAAPFLKHNIPMPAKLSAAWNNLISAHTESALQPRETGEVMTGSDGLYVFNITIGTPPQTMTLLFDSGSPDFWVWSQQTPECLDKCYNSSASSTAQLFPGQTFYLDYTTPGGAEGDVYLDTVVVAAGNNGIMTVEGNPVECTTDVFGFFTTAVPDVDGVMGIDRAVNDSESPDPQQTWLNYVMGFLAEPVFTTILVQDGIGGMDFGFIDSSKYTGTLAYTPIVVVPNAGNTFLWSFEWSGYAIGTQTFNSTVIHVITDTGSNISNLPPDITAKYYAQVSGSYQQSDGSYAYPCSSTLPDFTFGVGTSKLVISGSLLTFAGIGGGDCYGAIQPGQGYAYFGLQLFYGLFVVHDTGAQRMGFAQRTSITSL